MTRSYRDLRSITGTKQRRDPRGGRHSKEGWNFDMAADNPAVLEARTRYPSMVTNADTKPLKSGHNNTKIGAMVEKGAWKYMPIYTLTLEERDTCPRSCLHYLDCFGNKLRYSIRQSPGPWLEEVLAAQLAYLAMAHPDGFVVRLHVLGDFYSVAYAELWGAWLKEYPALRVYGYTAWQPATFIGREIHAIMNGAEGARFRMRFSDGLMGVNATVSLPSAAAARDRVDLIVCPQQLGKTSTCGSCALCWETRKNIGFLDH